jgi:hypothetical protein
MSCDHDCARPPAFPKVIDNRPGLPAIDYRIGTYAEIRGHLLARLNASLTLAAWTHRGADDPGIALLEASSIVGDVLTFYQQLYANEAWLRTAEWKESVADLVRLSGYRLAPGVAGLATFALTVKGERAVTIPKATRIKVQLEPDPKPAEFETVAEATAVPGLSGFSLYRPGVTPAIVNGQRTFAADSALLAAQGVELKKGDRLMLVVNPSATRSARQTAVVAEVTESFGRTEITIEGRWTGPSVTGGVTAYKLGRAFRHFGGDAPSTRTVIQNGAAVQQAVKFGTMVSMPFGAMVYFIAGTYTWSSGPQSLPLDQEVDDLATGATVLISLQLSTANDGTGATHLCERRIGRLDKATVQWGVKEGGTSVIHLDNQVAASPMLSAPSGGGGGGYVIYAGEYLYSDVRSIEIHEVLGASFQLAAVPVPQTGATTARLAHYGTQADYTALNGRRLQFQRGESVEETTATIDAAAGAAAGERLRPVNLNPPLAEFGIADFPWDAPAVTVLGNLVDATQGKTEDTVALGDGDARQAFQTLAVPKAPLTYLLDPAATPACKPELEVRVDGVVWKRVDSLFGRKPDERVYIVREDTDGKSFVQFGDGKTGARLPSGKGNVTATYRTGIGAIGAPAPDAKPKAAGRLPDLKAIVMPEPATGGAPPETEDNARAAAPGRMQSLGRLVGLADYEAEALSVPGVLKARALWTGGGSAAPVIRIVVLSAAETPADADYIAGVLRAINASRGPSRWPVQVIQGERLPLTVELVAGFDATLDEAAVRDAVLEALGASGEEGNGVDSSRGLLSWQQRQFGETAHASQIIAAAQNVAGVQWVELRAIGSGGTLIRAGGATPLARRALACPQERILTLAAADLTLTLTAVTAQGAAP